jgi:hypothetical protein
MALAGWLFAAERGVGFVLTGESLGLDQRDVRVFNNFTDPEANLNQQPDLSFPGYVGAELAIWKGCVEWGSELHFEGAGDPLQPGDLGSGGANFDSSWQGRALDEGGLDDNVHSEIGGQGFGVIAFTETPSSDGWRIRYYRQPWVFYDNPNQGPNGNFQIDLQGVACHEYGHALGLGHSNDPDATMFGSVLANATSWRSIEDDDRAGIQVIYGPRASTKPSITGYALLGGGQVELHGTGFDALANEVWFTQAGTGGNGTPVVAGGLPAGAAGTTITLAVPPLAGPGDVLVKLPGTQGSALSNAFPFDPDANPCPQPVVYGTSKINSTGVAAHIGWAGTPSGSANNFRITLFDGPPGELGLAFSGPGQQATPFYGGWMLVSAPKQRHRSFIVDPFGFGSSKVKLTPGMVGVTRYYQVWYRDSLDPFGAGTSDALQVTICE